MTLIFSNENRLLFNIENPDRLVKLAYGNRFTLLVESGVANNTLVTDPLARTAFPSNPTKRVQDSTGGGALHPPSDVSLRARGARKGKGEETASQPRPVRGTTRTDQRRSSEQQGIPYKAYRARQGLVGRRKAGLGTYQQGRDLPKGKVCKKPFASTFKPFSRIQNSFKQVLFDLVRRKNISSLALEVFSPIELLGLYNLLQDSETSNSITGQVFLKNAFSILTRRHKSRSSSFFKSSDLHLDLFLENQGPRAFQGFIPGVTFNLRPLPLYVVQNRAKVSSSVSQDEALQHQRWWALLALQERYTPLARAKTKDRSIRSVWNTLLCSSTPLTDSNLGAKLLQGKENRPNLVSNPAPPPVEGNTSVDNPIGDSASFLGKNKPWWRTRAFYRSKVFTARLALQGLLSRASIKVFVPKTGLWGFAFSTSFLVVVMSSMLQREDQNRWFFVFSRNQLPGLHGISQESSWEGFENITLKHVNPKTLFFKPPNSKGLVRAIDPYKDIWCLCFSELWDQRSLQNYTAVFSGFSSNSKSNRGATGKKAVKTGWLFKPRYQLDARALPTRSSLELDPVHFHENTDKGGYSKAEQHKERVNTEDDSIPLKMSCSTGGSNKNLVFSPNGVVRDLFYRSGSLSIEDGAFQALPQDVDSFDDPPAPCNEAVFDRNRLSFLQQEDFFKRSNLFKAEGQQTGFVYPFCQLKRDCGVSSGFQAAHRSYHLCPQKVCKGFRPLFSKTKRLRLYLSTRASAPSLKAPQKRKRDGLSLKGLQSWLQGNLSFRGSHKQKNLKRKEPCKAAFFKMYGLRSKQMVSGSEGFVNNRNPLLSDPALFQTPDRKLSRSPEKTTGYLLSKRNRIGNRFMSGYRLPETKTFQVGATKGINREGNLVFAGHHLRWSLAWWQNKLPFRAWGLFSKDRSGFAPTTHSIKIPPALPFYESKVKKANPDSWLQGNLSSGSPSTGVRALNRSQIEDLHLWAPPYKTKICAWRNGGSIPQGVGNKQSAKGPPLFSLQDKISLGLEPTSDRIKPLKRIPYRKLLLHESEEISPLFNEVSKTFRISPYRFRFKKLLFTDYNDYLSWQKDTSAAISIAPSLEEDKTIKDSWLQLFSPKTLGGAFQDAQQQPGNKDRLFVDEPGSAKNQETTQTSFKRDAETKPEQAGGFASKQTPLSANLNENGPLEHLQAQDKALQEDLDRGEKQKEDAVWSSQERLSDPSAVGEEEDKKKGLTRFEWLQQIREADRLVEKRKDFQKEAYPNREALFVDRLQSKPGRVKRLLVTDRKESFFGIANLFPKRLVAQDQKQIKHQLLREDQDQKAVSLLHQLSQKTGNLNQSSFSGLDTSNHISVEELLKSGALENLEKGNVFGSSSETAEGANPSPLQQRSTLDVLGRQGLLSSLRAVPRNKETKKVKDDTAPKTSRAEGCFSEQDFKKLQDLFAARQHPIYTPNRRLRLRMPQSSLSLQNNSVQSRLDDLNLSQSHRWWQKRRIGSSLLGAPSKRYLVMPEIRSQDWKKIIEWQLKTYLLEEEKRIELLCLQEKGMQKHARLQNPDLYGKWLVQSEASLPPSTEKTHGDTSGEDDKLSSRPSLQPKDLFKIKKIAVYLPWTALKKPLKKPFEWPITGLSYRSSLHEDSSVLQSVPFFYKDGKQGFRQNKKARSCFVAPIAPNFKGFSFAFSTFNGLPVRGGSQKQLHQTSVYKPFLFEETPKNVSLLLHSLALAVVLKQFLLGLSRGFGKVITQKIKNSSVGLALLPVFFNARSQRNQIPEFSHLKKRLKDLLSSEETVSSLSELVWYLRNSCRGRMIPRGVVLLETFSSETTAFLKAIGGEAQVPVIVQSLRGLPFTQSHPQRHFEKILRFAQKRSPCILFLDDLDSIGQSRTLLLKNNVQASSFWDQNENTVKKDSETVLENKLYNFAGGNKETFEKRKWKKPNTGACSSSLRHLLPQTGRKEDLDEMGSKIGTTPLSISRTWKNSKSQTLHALSVANSLYSKSGIRQKSSCFTNAKTHRGKRTSQSGLPAPSNSFLPLRPPFSKENGTVPLSETEKIVEQRRVDLMLRLLTVMDGISHLKGVLIVTTSKNPTLLDPALLRPGRFEKLINLKLPNKKKRIELLKLETKKIGYTNPMPWEYLGTETQDMTGTEIASAINHSAFRAILQSTVHTFSTLEHGIRFTKGEPFSATNPEKQKGIHRNTPLLDEEVSPSLFTAGKKSGTWCKQKRYTDHSFLENTSPDGQIKIGKSAPFLKWLTICNPYKSFSVWSYKSKICNRFHETKKNPKKVHSLASEIVFYQAGKGVIQSCLLNKTNKTRSSFLSLSSHSTQRSFTRRGQTTQTDFFSTRPDFTEKIVQLYAGKASLSLYLDATSNLKNKVLGRSVQQPLFLESNLSFKEGLHASLILENCLTFVKSFKKGDGKPLTVRCHPRSPKNRFKGVQTKKGLTFKTVRDSSLQTKIKPTVKRERFLKPRDISKKSWIFDSSNFFQHNLRKYSDFDVSNEPNDFVLIYDKTDIDLWWGEKTSEMIKTIKRPLGNWYRLYLPKLEEDKNNREWLLPDKFSDQHISISKNDMSDQKTRYTSINRFGYNTLFDKKKHNGVTSNTTQSVTQKALQNSKFQDKAFLKNQKFQFHKENATDFSYYSIVLTCFYSAFQNCAENRELLDFLSDHLIRFKTLRVHETMRIVSFYL